MRCRTGPATSASGWENCRRAGHVHRGVLRFQTRRNADGIGLRKLLRQRRRLRRCQYHRRLGIRGVNGHSYLCRKSGHVNLAIVATITQEHHADPKAYVRQLAASVNAAAGGYPVRQQLADLLPGCQPPAGVQVTNPKTRPGRLQDVLPAALLDAFCGYIEALGQVEPAVLAADGLVYAPEIKYYAYQVPVDSGWQSTDIEGLYVTGNAAGYTASLSAAALTGIIAADAITTGIPAAPRGPGQARS